MKYSAVKLSLAALGLGMSSLLMAEVNVTLELGAFAQDTDDTAYATPIASLSNTRPAGHMQYAKSEYKLVPSGTIAYLLGDRRDISFKILINQHSSDDELNSTTGFVKPTHTSNGQTSDSANTDFSYKTNSYDLAFGQYFTPTQKVTLHPSLGVTLANISLVQTTNYVGVGGNASRTITVTDKADVNALGLVLGSDGRYQFADGYSLMSDFSLAVLVGDASSSYVTEYNWTTSPYDTSGKSRGSIISRITGKLAVSKEIRVRDRKSVLSLGYRATYYGGIKQYTTLGNSGGFDPLTTATNSERNVGFSGPFLSVTSQFS